MSKEIQKNEIEKLDKIAAGTLIEPKPNPLKTENEELRKANTRANQLIGAQAEANDKLVKSLNEELARVKRWNSANPLPTQPICPECNPCRICGDIPPICEERTGDHQLIIMDRLRYFVKCRLKQCDNTTYAWLVKEEAIKQWNSMNPKKPVEIEPKEQEVETLAFELEKRFYPFPSIGTLFQHVASYIIADRLSREQALIKKCDELEWVLKNLEVAYNLRKQSAI